MRIRNSHTYLYKQGYHMAQSETKERALLGIEPFWEKPTLEPPLRWDRWQIMLKLAIMAKQGISIDFLLEDLPDKVIIPPEPVYEDHLKNSTSQSERDRRTRNEQLKNSWLIRCPKIELVSILCGEKPWKYCDNKAVSLTYLSLGMEVPCALLATILPLLHPKEQRQQTLSLRLLSRKRHHNLQ